VRSGFVAVSGRPNVGKSTLVNQIVGSKVSITSVRPNTTRLATRGILQRPDAQVIFVDTPGIHRPRSALGVRLNEVAEGSLDDVDQILAVVEATAAVGPGDRTVLEHSLSAVRRSRALGMTDACLFVVVNKIDRARSHQVLERLATVCQAVEALDAPTGSLVPVEYFPVSAATGEGVAPLVEAILARLPDGPAYYPLDAVSDTPEAVQVAELVREQLLIRARDELPHSIACRVTEWEWPRIRCEILVERSSQKAIVIGKGGEVLKAVGTAVRSELAPGAFLELFVRVEPHWHQRDASLDRLGF
jgi:GTPase